jgi:hypothetical protein
MDHPLCEAAYAAEENKGHPMEDAVTPSPQPTANVNLPDRAPVKPLDREALKRHVLRTYTSSGGQPVISSVVTDESELTEEDRARMRLARLQVEDKAAAGGGGTTSLLAPPVDSKAPASSLVEIITLLEHMNTELKNFWDAGNRVRALRVAIQSSKVLFNASKVPGCFPSIFVLVATVLDSLGDLVAERILQRAAQENGLIAKQAAEGVTNFDFVPPEAVEMCTQWFNKILSIRELLSRVIVELALLRCFKYVTNKMRLPLKQVVVRLAAQIRGVGDPLVAAHMRWYLFLRAGDVLGGPRPPGFKETEDDDGDRWARPLGRCVMDNLDMLARMPLAAEHGSRGARLHLFQPSLRWMLDCVFRHGGDPDTFAEKVVTFVENRDTLLHGAIVQVLLQTIPPAYLAANEERMWGLVDRCAIDTATVSRARVVGAFAFAMADDNSGVGAESKATRTKRLNAIWSRVTAEGETVTAEDFVYCASAAAKYCAKYMSVSALATVVAAARTAIGPAEQNVAATTDGAEASRKLADNPLSEGVIGLLQTLIAYVLPDKLLVLDPFMNMLLLSPLVPPGARTRLIVDLLKRPINSPSTAQAALELCRHVHDSLTLMATPADVAEAERVVINVIRAAFSSTQIESQLRFYSECRHALSRFDGVRAALIYEAMRLFRAVPHEQIARRRAQMKPCLAYVHATAPGVANPGLRIRAVADAACVALQRGFVAQAEALLATALQSLRDWRLIETRHADPNAAATDGTEKTESFEVRRHGAEAMNVARLLLNIAVAVPPHAKHGDLYIAAAVIDWASQAEWPTTIEGKPLIAVATLVVLARARMGDLQQRASRHDFAYEFPALRGANPHLQPEFGSAADAVAVEALHMLKCSLPTGGIGALDAVQTLVPTLAKNKEDRGCAIALHLLLQQLLAGRYDAGGDAAFTRQKTAVVATIKAAFSDSAEWDALVAGSGVASLTELQQLLAAAPEEEAEDNL